MSRKLTLFAKIKLVFKEQLLQGATPRGLALTLAMAFAIGVLPILGSTTLLCALAAWKFKLNQPLIQILNYLFYPLQLIFLPGFLSLGQFLFRAPQLQLAPQDIFDQFSKDALKFISDYTLAGVHAVVAWALLVPAVAYLVFRMAFPFLVRLQKMKKTENETN